VALLNVQDAVVDYHVPGRATVHAVAGVSISVEPGEIVGLVGESGCGKSTLGRAIVGLQKLTSGTVALDGHPVAPVGRGARPVRDRGLQMVFQDPYSSLNPRRRIGRQIADGLRRDEPGASTDPRPVGEQVTELLESVGLAANVATRFPHEFSGGQRQRIAIARALAPNPSIIVADEPVSALDASTRAQVTNLLTSLAAERGMGLLFISHDLSGVRHMADRVAVMYLGRIVENSPTEPLWGDPLHPYSEALIRAIPKLGMDAAAPVAPSGEVPDPANPPTGCRFHPRCPYAMDRCITDDPALVHIDGSREAACWLQPEDGPARRLLDVSVVQNSTVGHP